MLIDYIKLDKLRSLLEIEDDVFTYYYILERATEVKPERYTILYLCPNIKEVVRCFNYLVDYYTEDCYISNNKSEIIAKDLNHKRIIFYNSSKDREELIYIFPLKKLKQGFDDYRISEIRFFGLDGCVI